MAVIETTIRKKQGEDVTNDIRNIIRTKLNNDQVFIELLEEAVPVQGISDEGKPYILLVNDYGAIVIIRKDNRNVLLVFIKANNGISEIDSILRGNYAIYAFRGRTSPYERQIKNHILELLAEDEPGEEKEGKDESDGQDIPDNSDKNDKRHKKDREPNEPDQVYEEVFRTAGDRD